jgi:hypothetical protein
MCLVIKHKLKIRSVSSLVLLLFLPVTPFCRYGFCQSAYLQGQLSGWLSITDARTANQLGLRYIPAVFTETYLSENLILDAEISLKTAGTMFFSSEEPTGSVDMYRIWLRITKPQMEIRAGLQKINFGTAKILRPLKWFDRIDPRDPQQLTDGVYGLLARYIFLNNANIWLWGLYGNNGSKGIEAIPTKKNSMEFGGRAQHPMANGELAFTYHHRTVAPEALTPALNLTTTPENRFALDGIWDVGIGLWFEAVLVHQNMTFTELKYRNFLTVGGDYTIGFKSGLHVLAEHLWLSVGEKTIAMHEKSNTSALMMDYNLTLLDRITVIVTRQWESRQWSRFASWGRIYDNWSFYLNLFWNSRQTANLISENTNSFSKIGKGVQVLAVFNH